MLCKKVYFCTPGMRLKPTCWLMPIRRVNQAFHAQSFGTLSFPPPSSGTPLERTASGANLEDTQGAPETTNLQEPDTGEAPNTEELGTEGADTGEAVGTQDGAMESIESIETVEAPEIFVAPSSGSLPSRSTEEDPSMCSLLWDSSQEPPQSASPTVSALPGPTQLWGSSREPPQSASPTVSALPGPMQLWGSSDAHALISANLEDTQDAPETTNLQEPGTGEAPNTADTGETHGEAVVTQDGAQGGPFWDALTQQEVEGLDFEREDDLLERDLEDLLERELHSGDGTAGFQSSPESQLLQPDPNLETLPAVLSNHLAPNLGHCTSDEGICEPPVGPEYAQVPLDFESPKTPNDKKLAKWWPGLPAVEQEPDNEETPNSLGRGGAGARHRRAVEQEQESLVPRWDQNFGFSEESQQAKRRRLADEDDPVENSQATVTTQAVRSFESLELERALEPGPSEPEPGSMASRNSHQSLTFSQFPHA